MLTGLAAFSQEQPKATDKAAATTQAPQTPAVPVKTVEKEKTDKETTTTTQQPAATVKEEKATEQKKEPAKKLN